MTDDDKPQNGPCSDTHAAAAPARAALPGQDSARADDDMPLLPLAIPDAARRVRGRPARSPNIRTNKTFEVAVSRYGDPLIAEIAIGNMAPDELIKWVRTIASDCGLKVGATVMDVLRFQASCREAALPYGHARRAPTNEKGETVLPIIGLGMVAPGNAPGGHVAGLDLESAIDAEFEEVQQDQEVSEAAGGQSHDKKSHDAAGD